MIGGGKNRPELRSANHDFSCEIQEGIKVLTILLPRSTSYRRSEYEMSLRREHGNSIRRHHFQIFDDCAWATLRCLARTGAATFFGGLVT